MSFFLLTIFITCYIQAGEFSLSITAPGDVVAGRPFTLECRITRQTGNRSTLIWSRDVGQKTARIYASSNCTSSIQLPPLSPPGLSGGCQHVNSEELYTVTIQNVTEDTGRGRWRCVYGSQADNVTLDVKVMVTSVTFQNRTDAVVAGSPTNFTCLSSPSYPKACVKMYKKSSGNVRELYPRDCNQNSSSVEITTRTFTFTASAKENGAKLYCNASNNVTDPPVQSQPYTLNVQYPPQNGVLLSGYVNNTAVEPGKTLTLTCQVGEGNPRPALTWSSGCGQTNTVPGNDGCQQISISITVNASLNQKTCVCKGSQDGSLTEWTEQKSITFNVTFGPNSVQHKADSGQSGNSVTVTENSNVTFTCNTSESNPAAVLSWYNNSSRIAAGISAVSSQRGPNHGYLITQRYTVRVDRYQDGDVIRCEAQRPGNGGSKRVSSNLTLNVTYGPMFTSCKSSYIFVENDTADLSCTAWAKPQPTISWSRGAQPSDVSVTNHRCTSAVRFSRISRTDSGDYTVTANNSVRGGVRRTVNVTVYYPPDVSVALVSGDDLTEGNNLQLECRAVAVPQNYTYLDWSRTVGDRPVPLTNSSPGRYLSISQVTFRDQGVYRCGASNGFGGVQRGQLEIRVRAQPKFLGVTSKQAAAQGENVKLVFNFVSYPANVTIKWYKLVNNTINGTSGRLISNTTGSNYRTHLRPAELEFLFHGTKVLLSGHVAELEISKIKRDDFGEYKFVAENDVGSSEFTMSLNLIVSTADGPKNALVGLIAGSVSGAIVLLGVVLLVLVIFRKRKQETHSSKDTEKIRPGDVSSGAQSTRHYENTTGVCSSANEHEPTTSAGHTGAYEEVDLVPNTSPSVSGRGTPTYAEVNKSQTTNEITTAQPVPIYAEVNKAKKISETAQAPEGPVYAEVNKTQKKINEKTASEGPVYAEVNKTEKKANEKKGAFGKAKGMFKGKQKGKPTDGDKTGLINGKAKSGSGQISVDTFANAAFAGDEVTYSNSGDVDSMEQSGRAGQMKGPPDLVYADMDFAGTNPIVHPAQNTTTYASIAFGQVGPPVVYDTDEDDGNPKSSEGKA